MKLTSQRYGENERKKKIVTTSSFSFDRPSYILIKIVKWFTLAFGYYFLTNLSSYIYKLKLNFKNAKQSSP